MDEALLKYLTEDERELLKLLPHQLKYLAEVKEKQGSLHPQDEQAQKELGTIETIISQAAQFRKDAEQFKKDTQAEKEKPIERPCPNCNAIEMRKPTGTKKIKSGYTCNRYYCTHCKTLFVDYMPNNLKDQISWFDNFIEKMETEHKDKFLTTPQAKQSFETTKSDRDNLKKIFAEQQKIIQAERTFNASYNKIIAGWRNQLLLAKVQHLWTGTNKLGSS